MTFEAIRSELQPQRVHHYRLHHRGEVLNYKSFLYALAGEPSFRKFFTELLKSADFAGFRWETPPISTSLIDREFEFVLLRSDQFADRETEPEPFAKHFRSDDGSGVVVFSNLGNDATLIAPTPLTCEEAYGHLAAFVRLALPEQVDAMWQQVGETMLRLVSKQPRWLSTAGGGVAWLHVRVDSSPKYFGHTPYREVR
ncbi:conserved hypothetical protein [Pirellula staleyi DSM 6068]|uniref:Uncharacterized protein n=1 Tax=Pirellula staleyi (strain ATCC 27377 / DSM 6068 / ICPB 4128) TaxID=530564 RepID=D2R173_PIRSD|nr:hypothetical protein [Pirellula staleyi]ADB18558.1 conserved hypothetical protein [Pirellula staleyi DSM 6068]